MGQQFLCGSAIDKYQNDQRFTIVGSFKGNDTNMRQSYLNVCKEFGIGQYMVHNQNQQVDKMWKELYGISQLLYIQNDDQQSLQTRQEFRTKYNFIVNQSDEIIASIWILDKKGYNYIVSLGPTPEYRWSCWKLILLHKRFSKIVYEDQLCQLNESSNQIGLDVQRTLITHNFFKQQTIGQNQLLRILNAISISFPKLGYCQGMNFLTGFLLLVSGCDERLAFDCFLQLLVSPKYLFYYLFSEKLPLLHLMTYFCHQQLKEQDLEVYNHLQNQQIPDSFWLTKMILSIFLYVIPTQQCIRMWDYIISYGFVAILELIVAIVKNMREDILKADLEKIGSIFQGQLNKKEIDVEFTISQARNNCQISRKKIVQMTQGFLKNMNNLSNDQGTMKFWKIFLDYEKKQLFTQKMNYYIINSEL